MYASSARLEGKNRTDLVGCVPSWGASARASDTFQYLVPELAEMGIGGPTEIGQSASCFGALERDDVCSQSFWLKLAKVERVFLCCLLSAQAGKAEGSGFECQGFFPFFVPSCLCRAAIWDRAQIRRRRLRSPAL